MCYLEPKGTGRKLVLLRRPRVSVSSSSTSMTEVVSGSVGS